jgi:hypothetical protein
MRDQLVDALPIGVFQADDRGWVKRLGNTVEICIIGG